MRRSLLRAMLVPGIVVAAACGEQAARETAPPVDSTAVRAAILADRQAIWNAFFANDSAAMQALLPPHVVAINNADSVWLDRSGVLTSAAQFQRDGGRLVRLEFPRTEFQIFGEVAVLYSIFSVELTIGGNRVQTIGRATEVFVHRNGRWQNAGWHLDSGR